MVEKLITKSFERLLDKGNVRGFITYEELGKSLGKRGSSNENIEKAFLIIADNKVTLVEKKSQYQSNKKKKLPVLVKKNNQIKVMIQLECIFERWVELNYFHVKEKLQLLKELKLEKT